MNSPSRLHTLGSRVALLLLVLVLFLTSTAPVSAASTSDSPSSPTVGSAAAPFAAQLFSSRPTRKTVIQFSIGLMLVALFIMLRK